MATDPSITTRHTPRLISGLCFLLGEIHPREEGMVQPALCLSCAVIYDMTELRATTVQSDRVVWRCPSCGASHDTRVPSGAKPGEHMGYNDMLEPSEGLTYYPGPSRMEPSR